MRQTSTLALALAAAATASACGGVPDSLAISEVEPACNPLGGGVACLMPWPSSAYLRADDTAPSGYRVDLPADAMPVNKDGVAVNPATWNRYDGFAPSGTILAAFPNGVSPVGLPGHWDPAASLAVDAPIALLNLETRERVAFFAEVDMNAPSEPLRALIIHPLERMAPGTRHAVAVRNTVLDADGVPLTASEEFAAIAEGRPLAHPLNDKLLPAYDDIFAALQDQGIEREELVLAWDFVTASDEMLTSDLRSMRAQAEPVIGDAGANVTFELEQEPFDDPDVHAVFHGTYTAPNFLTDGERTDSVLNRADDGAPVLDGSYDANVTVLVPSCVTRAPLPLPVMIFGHGLFGSAKGYAGNASIHKIANERCMAVVAGDWIGLTRRQLEAAVLSALELTQSDSIVDKLEQSVINFIALENLARGPLARAAELRYDDQPILDPARVTYLGASLGGIMGGVFMSYDRNVELGVLGVPGAAWSLLMERSFAFAPLQLAALLSYKSQYTYQVLLAMLAMNFERVDPVTTAGHVIRGSELLGVPPKQLFLYQALNDSLVHNLATETYARALDIPVTGPSVKKPWGLAEKPGPLDSALTIYDENVAQLPIDNQPPEQDNGTHVGINSREAVARQVRVFFEEQFVSHQCARDGQPVPCNCANGACD